MVRKEGNMRHVENLKAMGIYPPQGTWGLVTKSGDDYYGVAADWGEASAPVYFLDAELEWRRGPHQVADFRHSPEEALEFVLAGEARFWASSNEKLEAFVNQMMFDAEDFDSSEFLEV